MKKTVKISEKTKLTEKQKREIESAKTREMLFDEDSPEFTMDMLEQLKKTAEKRRIERQKQVLTLRVSNDTMNKAKALGKGYTGILSRIIEYALNHPEIIEKCL